MTGAPKSILRASAAALALLAFPLAAAAAPALRVAAAPQVMEAGPLLYAAQQMGPDAVVVVPGGVANLFAPGDQAADLAGNAETQGLRVSVEHPDLRIIQTVVEGLYGIVARRSAGIAAVKDLKGKRLGVTASTSAAYFAHRMLQRAGLADGDVTLVSLAPNALPGALADRSVDAIAIWEPQASQGEAVLGQDAVVLPGAGVYREIYNLNTTAAALADPVRRARIVAYVKALAQASKVSADQPAKVWPLVARSSGFSEQTIASGWPHHRFGAALAGDLLDVLEDEERWLAPQAQRAPRSRAELARLIDAGVAREALGKAGP
ncbi:MAG: ABC transporter substrate-binding protein [Caulobacteraceae bacterium]